jgi:predicted nucleic acid-binding protein
MNVVDSSGWLEYFADSNYADFFADAIEDRQNLVVPAISIYEVYKRLYIQRGRDIALEAIAYMQTGKVVDMDTGLAIEAAEFSAEKKVPMADSIIYKIAQSHKAILWTQDIDLEGLDGVQYQKKQTKA